MVFLAVILVSSVGNVVHADMVVATVTLGSIPGRFAFNPSNNDVYVSNFGELSNTVSVISGTTLVGTVTVGSNPEGLAFNPSNNDMYVANVGSNTVSVISGITLVGTVAVGTGPFALAFNPSNNDIYVGNLFSGTVSVIQTPQQAVTSLGGQVSNLGPPSGPLNSGQVNSLLAKLNNAIAKLNSGQTKAGCNLLSAFISEVQSDITNGVLTPAQGNPLITQAQLIESAVPC